jgi:hypothetical protein
MTDEQINTRIAEACGAKKWNRNGGPFMRKWMIKTIAGWENNYPDYCHDLNAMHQAEKILTVEQWHDYVDFMPSRWECAVHASARQRAEAFLRTLGKWEDSK